jgi:hypothetical protein
MAITVKTQPEDLVQGYSAIPLRVVTDDLTSEQLKYLINITYLESEYSSDVVVGYDNQSYTKITTTLDHGYSVGDLVLFYNPNTPSYTGVYTIKSLPATDEFIIDLVQGAPIDNTTASYFYRIVPFSLIPDLDYEAKLDLSNVIKDFVTQNFEDTGEIYEALDTYFDYGLTIGTESKYVFNFTDNFFVTGSFVGFNDPSGTALDVDNSPFQVGDRINIQQDLYEWEYEDNTFDAGDLAFTSTTTDHNIPVGTQIIVSGQITEPSYNGATTVTEVIDVKTIKVNKPFVASTPAEGGKILGVITPSYNTVATITDIYYDGVLGYVIETDIPYTIATPAIGGTIKFADGRVSQNFIETKIDDLTAYNSKVKKIDYNFSNDFDPYVVQARAFTENNLSTILSSMDVKNLRFRIEKSTKSWLLCQSKDVGLNKANPFVTCFDSSDAIISQFRINNYQDFDNFYFPIGIDQMIVNSDTTLIAGSSLATVQDDVAYYQILVDRNGNIASNNMYFEVNDDCSRYDIYHLCWKDSRGSWLSYPFKYIQKNITEVERKNYYKKEGTWDMTNDLFGYEDYGRGDTTYFSRSRDKMILNSGWIEEFENEIIQDLFESPSVMVQTPEGNMLGVTMNTNKQEWFKKQSDYLWQYQFEVTLARNENRF